MSEKKNLIEKIQKDFLYNNLPEIYIHYVAVFSLSKEYYPRSARSREFFKGSFKITMKNTLQSAIEHSIRTLLGKNLSIEKRLAIRTGSAVSASLITNLVFPSTNDKGLIVFKSLMNGVIQGGLMVAFKHEQALPIIQAKAPSVHSFMMKEWEESTTRNIYNMGYEIYNSMNSQPGTYEID